MDYPKSVPSVGLVNGKFVDENPVSGTPGSLIPSSWGNAVTDEILSVIRSTNVVPAESNNAQLTDAIVSIADLRASQAVSKAVVQASESASGVAKVASQAQTNSGVDDTTIVTPKKMAGAVQSQALVAFTTAGTAPQFTLAPVPAITAYTANQRFQVKFHSGGAGSDKMNISGLGAKSIVQYDASGNKVAAVIQGQLTDAVYDGTDIVLLDQLPNAFGVTSQQFDNSTKLATTAFIQGVGFQFSGAFGLNASTTLNASTHAGALVVATNTSVINVTLPLASSMPAKSVIKFWSYGAGGMSIVAAGSDSILLPAVNTTFPLLMGASVTLASNGVAGWYAIDMSATSPAGAIIQVASLTVPLGYLKANGAAVSRVSYASLFAVIGTVFGVGDGSTTFNVPDLRGEFIRGVDDGRGVDVNRTLGSFQAQDIQPHTHTVYSSGNNTSYGYQGTGSGPGVYVATTSAGVTETRPRNVALLHCIKY